ncbi:MAG: YceI family protein [Planctomycetes bacterium]|nr:YceI family protein [Planctomycetota bacterium]MBI3833104.1 YceI family protein [Planctomycetota bacterium]
MPRPRLFGFAAFGLVLVLHGQSLLAKPQEFDFKDPKGVNTISFFVDSVVEPIQGIAGGVSGKVSFDPENPTATTGKISVEVSTMHTANKGMSDALQGPDWLDAKGHPTIDFTIKKVTDARKKEDNSFEFTMVGELNCKGVSKEQTVVVQATIIPDGMSQRQKQGSGDLLILRADFVMKRADYKIKPDMPGKLVGEEIQLRVAIVGGAAKK